VQSSGGFQLIFNLAALIVVAPIAERVLSAATTLAVFLLAGVTSHVVSTAGWATGLDEVDAGVSRAELAQVQRDLFAARTAVSRRRLR
jgi:membrane associated rhomboid family serine protease